MRGIPNDPHHDADARGRNSAIRLRAVLALVIALAMPLVAAPTTYAAAPSNDDSTNATILTSFPIHQTVDLGEATLQGDEPWCGGHAASVWYRYTAPAEQTLTIRVTDTEPDTRVCVLPDAIGAGNYRLVSPSETVNMLVDAGRTYYILLGTLDPTKPAALDLAVGPPYSDLSVTVDKAGIADRVSGAAIVGGTLTCSGTAAVDLFVRVQEKVTSKKSVDMSDGKYAIPCSTTTTRWQMRLYANIAYVPGTATVSIWAGGGDDVDQFITTVKLGAK